MRSQSFLALAAPTVVMGALHRMFVGNLYGPPPQIYALQFDDQSLELKMTKNITGGAGHAWINLNHDKSVLYGVSLQDPRIFSYSVLGNGTDLAPPSTLPFDGSCRNKTSAFVIGSDLAPYRVYSAAWPGPESCSSAHAAAPGTGFVNANTQSWRYLTASGVHGLDLGRRGATQLIYSADLNGDSVWTHAVDAATGIVKELDRRGVTANSHPRHLAAHPSGNYLYVLMESGNTVVSYSLDPATGVPVAEAATFDLLPPAIRKEVNELNSTTQQYWSAEVMVSHDGRYLWATARAGRDTTNYGYVNGFLLGADGKVLKQLFQAKTKHSQGIANAIAPAPKELGNEWAAMTDIKGDRARGMVYMWKMTGRRETELGVEYSGAEVVSEVDLSDTGCCANVAWID